MRTVEKTRKEIEAKMSGMGDYVKIGYLTTCLKNPLDFDTRKFVLFKLSELYESRKMFSDAGKCMRNAAEIEALLNDKINDYLKSAELFIKAGNYDDADLSFKKAQAIANSSQKEQIKKSVKNFYITQSDLLMKSEKRKQAAEIYERMLTMDLNIQEKEDIRQKLLVLYEKLGKIREYYNLKNKSFKVETNIEKEEKEEKENFSLLGL